MGLAFELEVAPSRVVAWAHRSAFLLGAVGFALGSWHLFAGPTLILAEPAGWRLAAALVAGLAAATLVALSLPVGSGSLRAGRRGAVALQVAADGACRLLDRAAGTSTVVAATRAHVLPGLILVALAPDPAPSAGSGVRGAERTLALGWDAMPPETWRKLKVWLLWMARGRHLPPAP